MAAPALIARVVAAALKRYAPKYVGAALRVLGVIELADLARDAYHVLFGGSEPHAEAVRGFESESAPAGAVELMRHELAGEAVTEAPWGDDPIDEEEILRSLDRAEAGACPDITVALVPPRRRRKG